MLCDTVLLAKRSQTQSQLFWNTEHGTHPNCNWWTEQTESCLNIIRNGNKTHRTHTIHIIVFMEKYRSQIFRIWKHQQKIKSNLERLWQDARTLPAMWYPYEGCPESIRTFWISPEPVAWPWCNLAASQRRPYCASVNSHCPVGLVSRQWEAVDWTCVLCDRHIHRSPIFQRRF